MLHITAGLDELLERRAGSPDGIDFARNTGNLVCYNRNPLAQRFPTRFGFGERST
jgi:hypothetical protein